MKVKKIKTVHITKQDCQGGIPSSSCYVQSFYFIFGEAYLCVAGPRCSCWGFLRGRRRRRSPPSSRRRRRRELAARCAPAPGTPTPPSPGAPNTSWTGTEDDLNLTADNGGKAHLCYQSWQNVEFKPWIISTTWDCQSNDEPDSRVFCWDQSPASLDCVSINQNEHEPHFSKLKLLPNAGRVHYQRMYPTPKQHTAARPHDLLGYRWLVVRISMMMKGRTVVCWRQRDTG